ncbi:unnamed protein product [Amoebophrya sp. A120]|nr:unnamed protein product [Amoebophrya sp. A120]|eukprot:GSA120T00024149001.1
MRLWSEKSVKRAPAALVHCPRRNKSMIASTLVHLLLNEILILRGISSLQLKPLLGDDEDYDESRTPAARQLPPDEAAGVVLESAGRGRPAEQIIPDQNGNEGDVEEGRPQEALLKNSEEDEKMKSGFYQQWRGDHETQPVVLTGSFSMLSLDAREQTDNDPSAARILQELSSLPAEESLCRLRDLPPWEVDPIGQRFETKRARMWYEALQEIPSLAEKMRIALTGCADQRGLLGPILENALLGYNLVPLDQGSTYFNQELVGKGKGIWFPLRRKETNEEGPTNHRQYLAHDCKLVELLFDSFSPSKSNELYRDGNDEWKMFLLLPVWEKSSTTHDDIAAAAFGKKATAPSELVAVRDSDEFEFISYPMHLMAYLSLGSSTRIKDPESIPGHTTQSYLTRLLDGFVHGYVMGGRKSNPFIPNPSHGAGVDPAGDPQTVDKLLSAAQHKSFLDPILKWIKVRDAETLLFGGGSFLQQNVGNPASQRQLVTTKRILQNWKHLASLMFRLLQMEIDYAKFLSSRSVSRFTHQTANQVGAGVQTGPLMKEKELPDLQLQQQFLVHHRRSLPTRGDGSFGSCEDAKSDVSACPARRVFYALDSLESAQGTRYPQFLHTILIAVSSRADAIIGNANGFRNALALGYLVSEMYYGTERRLGDLTEKFYHDSTKAAGHPPQPHLDEVRRRSGLLTAGPGRGPAGLLDLATNDRMSRSTKADLAAQGRRGGSASGQGAAAWSSTTPSSSSPQEVDSPFLLWHLYTYCDAKVSEKHIDAFKARLGLNYRISGTIAAQDLFVSWVVMQLWSSTSVETAETFSGMRIRMGKERDVIFMEKLLGKIQLPREGMFEWDAVKKDYVWREDETQEPKWSIASTFPRLWLRGADNAGRSNFHLLYSGAGERTSTLQMAGVFFSKLKIVLDDKEKDWEGSALLADQIRFLRAEGTQKLHKDAPFGHIAELELLKTALEKRERESENPEAGSFPAVWQLFFAPKDLLRRSPLHVAAQASGNQDLLRFHLSLAFFSTKNIGNDRMVTDMILYELFQARDVEGETVFMRALGHAEAEMERAIAAASVRKKMSYEQLQNPSEFERISLDARAVWLTQFLFAIGVPQEEKKQDAAGGSSPRRQRTVLEQLQDLAPFLEIVLTYSVSPLGETVLHRAAMFEHLFEPVLRPILEMVLRARALVVDELKHESLPQLTKQPKVSSSELEAVKEQVEKFLYARSSAPRTFGMTFLDVVTEFQPEAAAQIVQELIGGRQEGPVRPVDSVVWSHAVMTLHASQDYRKFVADVQECARNALDEQKKDEQKKQDVPGGQDGPEYYFIGEKTPKAPPEDRFRQVFEAISTPYEAVSVAPPPILLERLPEDHARTNPLHKDFDLYPPLQYSILLHGLRKQYGSPLVAYNLKTILSFSYGSLPHPCVPKMPQKLLEPSLHSNCREVQWHEFRNAAASDILRHKFDLTWERYVARSWAGMEETGTALAPTAAQSSRGLGSSRQRFSKKKVEETFRESSNCCAAPFHWWDKLVCPPCTRTSRAGGALMSTGGDSNINMLSQQVRRGHPLQEPLPSSGSPCSCERIHPAVGTTMRGGLDVVPGTSQLTITADSNFARYVKVVQLEDAGTELMRDWHEAVLRVTIEIETVLASTDTQELERGHRYERRRRRARGEELNPLEGETSWVLERRKFAVKVVDFFHAVSDYRRRNGLQSIPVRWGKDKESIKGGQEAPAAANELFVQMGDRQFPMSETVWKVVTQDTPIFLPKDAKYGWPSDEEVVGGDSKKAQGEPFIHRSKLLQVSEKTPVFGKKINLEEFLYHPYYQSFPVRFTDNLLEIFRPVKFDDLLTTMTVFTQSGDRTVVPPVFSSAQVVSESGSAAPEVLVFHAGKRSKLLGIKKQGFFTPMVRRYSWYGKGFYFAVQMCKAHYYAQGEHETESPESKTPEGDEVDVPSACSSMRRTTTSSQGKNINRRKNKKAQHQLRSVIKKTRRHHQRGKKKLIKRTSTSSGRKIKQRILKKNVSEKKRRRRRARTSTFVQKSSGSTTRQRSPGARSSRGRATAGVGHQQQRPSKRRRRVHHALLIKANLGRICAVTQTVPGLEFLPPHCDSLIILPGLMWRWHPGGERKSADGSSVEHFITRSGVRTVSNFTREAGTCLAHMSMTDSQSVQLSAIQISEDCSAVWERAGTCHA